MSRLKSHSGIEHTVVLPPCPSWPSFAFLVCSNAAGVAVLIEDEGDEGGHKNCLENSLAPISCFFKNTHETSSQQCKVCSL